MPVHSDSLSTIVTKTSHYSVAKKQIRNEYLVNGAAHTGYTLDSVLGLGSRAAAVCAVRVTRELNGISLLETKDFLETPADVLEDLLALCGCATVLVSGDTLANSPSPQTNTVEALAYVHNNTHNLVVTIVLESLANSGQLCVQPQVVDGHGALVLERV